jgi:hypothetical protein
LGGGELIKFHAGSLDDKQTAIGHGVASIDREIQQDLIHHARIGMGEHRLRRHFELYLDGFAEDAFQHFGRVGDGFTQVQIARLEHFAATE